MIQFWKDMKKPSFLSHMNRFLYTSSEHPKHISCLLHFLIQKHSWYQAVHFSREVHNCYVKTKKQPRYSRNHLNISHRISHLVVDLLLSQYPHICREVVDVLNTMPTKYKWNRSIVISVYGLIVLVHLYESIPNFRDFNLLNAFHNIELPTCKRI